MMLDVLVITDEQWQTVVAAGEFGEYEPAEHFTDIEKVLIDACNALSYGSERSPLAEIALWETGDDANNDFLMTVDTATGVRLASLCIGVSGYHGYGRGPDGARAVLQDLIDLRNSLVAGLSAAMHA